MIKGAFTIDLGFFSEMQGSAVFEVNKAYSNKNICGFQFVNSNLAIDDGAGQKIPDSESAYFINLIDDTGYQFVNNVPNWIFNLGTYTGQVTFSPRKLDWTKCSVKWNQASGTNKSGVLSIIFFYA